MPDWVITRFLFLGNYTQWTLDKYLFVLILHLQLAMLAALFTQYNDEQTNDLVNGKSI